MRYNPNYTPGNCFEFNPCQTPCFNPPPQPTPCHRQRNCIIEIDTSELMFFMIGYLLSKNCK